MNCCWFLNRILIGDCRVCTKNGALKKKRLFSNNFNEQNKNQQCSKNMQQTQYRNSKTRLSSNITQFVLFFSFVCFWNIRNSTNACKSIKGFQFVELETYRSNIQRIQRIDCAFHIYRTFLIQHISDINEFSNE